MIKIYLSFAYFLLLVFDDNENIPFLCLSLATMIKIYLSFAYLSLLASPNSNFRRWTKIHLSITYFSKMQRHLQQTKKTTILPFHLLTLTKIRKQASERIPNKRILFPPNLIGTSLLFHRSYSNYSNFHVKHYPITTTSSSSLPLSLEQNPRKTNKPLP